MSAHTYVRVCKHVRGSAHVSKYNTHAQAHVHVHVEVQVCRVLAVACDAFLRTYSSTCLRCLRTYCSRITYVKTTPPQQEAKQAGVSSSSQPQSQAGRKRAEMADVPVQPALEKKRTKFETYASATSNALHRPSHDEQDRYKRQRIVRHAGFHTARPTACTASAPPALHLHRLLPGMSTGRPRASRQLARGALGCQTGHEHAARARA